MQSRTCGNCAYREKLKQGLPRRRVGGEPRLHADEHNKPTGKCLPVSHPQSSRVNKECTLSISNFYWRFYYLRESTRIWRSGALTSLNWKVIVMFSLIAAIKRKWVSRLVRCSRLDTRPKKLSLLLLKKILLFLQSGEGREKGRDTSMCGCPSHTPY